MKTPARDMFVASREEMWRIECRTRALGVIERAIDIAMTKLDDAEEAAVLAVKAFKAGLAAYEADEEPVTGEKQRRITFY
jgi:hypothetical protein